MRFVIAGGAFVLLAPLTLLAASCASERGRALVHESDSSENRPDPTTSRPDRKRGWPTELGHAIQDVARERRFGFLRPRMSGTKPVANDRLIPEEGVLHPPCRW